MFPICLSLSSLLFQPPLVAPEDAVLHAIRTLPVAAGYRRVEEPRPHLRCFGVSVIPLDEPTPAAPSSAAAAAVATRREYSYRKFWYCCAGTVQYTLSLGALPCCS